MLEQPQPSAGFIPLTSVAAPGQHTAVSGAGAPAARAGVATPRPPRPDWLKVRFPGGPNYLRLRRLMRELELHTVCEEARCPNMGECWEQGTATFLLLGEVCTRACGFCAITTGRPPTLDRAEPERVARAVQRLGLRHTVLTQVTRDDLPDGGAAIFAETIARIHTLLPDCSVEALISDLMGDWDALTAIMGARPEILNHNTETVPRLYRRVRPKARYERSLEQLDRAKALAPDRPTKSGLMLGLGETREELLDVLGDLRAVGCDILTLGQYLQPTPKHLPIVRYVPPEEFAELRQEALVLGFPHVESGPLVRSSYHAREQVDALGRQQG
jgi:lipoic acid synthetase